MGLTTDIQIVFKQLSVKVALSCPDFYGHFPERLAELHLKVKGPAGSKNQKGDLKKSRQISRLGIWAQGFFKDVTGKESEFIQAADLSEEDKNESSMVVIRIKDAKKIIGPQKRARDSETMLRRYKCVTGQSKFYSEVFESFSEEEDIKI